MERAIVKSVKYLEDKPDFVYNLETKNKNYFVDGLLTHNSPFVVLDEAALVDDMIESKVFRMIAGFSTTKHLYMKVGNPFYRNHFFKSHNDPDFHLVWFDYKRGVQEGRYTQAMLDKAKQKPSFDVLYEVKFPDASAVDEKGWSSLLSEEDVEACFVQGGSGFGFLKVGCDPAGEGTNFNTAIARYRNYAHILFKEKILDQFRFAEKIISFKNELKKQERLLPLGYFVDRVGIGEGYYQTLRMDLEGVYGVNVGKQALNTEEFVNLRAEAFWRLRQEIKSRKLQLEKSDDWFQLSKVKYRTRLEGKKGKIEIMSKEAMLAEGIASPDIADALMLTFTTLDPYETISPELQSPSMKQPVFDRYLAFNELP